MSRARWSGSCCTPGEPVIRVPPNLMAGARKSARTRGKSDPIDALAVARAAIREPDLPRRVPARPGARDRVVGQPPREPRHERTRACKRLRWLLHDIDPTLEPALRTLSNVTPLERLDRRLARRDASAAVRVARDLVAQIRQLSVRIDQLKRELAPLVRRHAPALLTLTGCGVAGRRPDPRRGRQRRALSDRRAARALRRRRPAGRLLRTPATPPAQPHRQPPAQPRAAHHRAHPGPHLPARARLPRAPAQPTARPPRKPYAPSSATSSAASSTPQDQPAAPGDRHRRPDRHRLLDIDGMCRTRGLSWRTCRDLLSSGAALVRAGV